MHCLFSCCRFWILLYFQFLIFYVECSDIAWLQCTHYLIESLCSEISDKYINNTLSCFSLGKSCSILPISYLNIAIVSDYNNLILFMSLKFSILIILWNLFKFNYFKHTMDRFSLPFIFFILVKSNRAFFSPDHHTLAYPTQRRGLPNYFGKVKYNI